jgi:hypothetical protein
MGNHMEGSQKIKTRIIMWYSNSILGIYPKEINSVSQGHICTPMFTTAVIFFGIDLQVSAERWINKQNVILFSFKKRRKSSHLQQHTELRCQ